MNEIVAQKLKRLRQEMTAQDIDLVALGPTAHTQWLLGYAPYPDERMCLLLISKTDEVFVMPALNANAVREHTDIEFCEWADDHGPFDALDVALEKVVGTGVKKVVLDETMRADFALNLLDKLDGATHQFTKSTVGALRMRKTEAEYQLLKLNAQIADEAQEVAAKTARPGVTESDVAEAVKEHFMSKGAKPVFDIIGANENGAFPHHHTSDRVLKSGDVVVVDIGGTTKGYPSDITRMVAVETLRDDYQEVHDVVEAAVQAALAACKPGVKTSDIDKAARDVITKAGYGEYFTHRTGHGLGIEIHEEPYLSASSDVILDEGMVFSIEPGIYIPGKFGIRLEEIVYLRADGPEVLSERPRDVVIAKN